MITMSPDEFKAACVAQGVPTRHIAFKCPVCKTVQSAHDLVDAGAAHSVEEVIDRYVGYSCVGRFKEANGRGCDWTLGGLFKLHELEVVDENGKHFPFFVLATPEEAQAHMHGEVTA